MAKTINIARDFSKYPAGRFKSYGPFTGEHFRERLVADLKKHDTLLIELDGTAGFGSSFLEEAFGGLVRKEGFVAAELHRRLSFTSHEEPSFIDEIWEDIDTATAANRTSDQ